MVSVLAVVVGGAGVMLLHARHHRQAVAQANSPKVIYHCPMHPQYFSDKPGTCPICGMKLVPVNGNASTSGASEPGSRKILYYRDAMNPSNTSPHPGKAPDGMDMVPVYADEAGEESGTVRIDPTVVQNIGVTTETAAIRNLTKEISASTTLELNETAVTIVTTKVMGWIENLYVDYTGQSVKKGQPLLTIYSPDLVSTQEEYLQALQYRNTLSAGSPEAVESAMELVESSRRRLLNWDISEAQIDLIAKSGTPLKAMTMYSPAGGVVLEKQVQAGQNVTPGMELYKIADLSRVWAIADVYQDDLPFIKIGTRAVIDVASDSGKEFSGRVEFISPVLDAVTKTASVRITIRNTPDCILKPRMFVTVRLASPAAVKALSVSQQAILHTGKRDVVVVALGNGRFRPQELKLGVSADGFTQVLSGLTEGQVVVTSSQFLIDAESNLRAAIGQMGGIETPAPPAGEKAPDTEEMKSMQR
jgi:Cu(I)/Ag(I) efflux system membrane fusion protein/cobalt-zinc-cadmium efflux system membrane fusion protein